MADVIEVVQLVSGNPVVIHLKPGWWPESYSKWVDRSAPECETCEREMRFDGTNNVNPWDGDEWWRCPICGHSDAFWKGDYGQVETEMTEEEWNDSHSRERDERYLDKRYGTTTPASIRDYWLKNETSE